MKVESGQKNTRGSQVLFFREPRHRNVFILAMVVAIVLPVRLSGQSSPLRHLQGCEAVQHGERCLAHGGLDSFVGGCASSVMVRDHAQEPRSYDGVPRRVVE